MTNENTDVMNEPHDIAAATVFALVWMFFWFLKWLLSLFVSEPSGR